MHTAKEQKVHLSSGPAGFRGAESPFDPCNAARRISAAGLGPGAAMLQIRLCGPAGGVRHFRFIAGQLRHYTSLSLRPFIFKCRPAHLFVRGAIMQRAAAAAAAGGSSPRRAALRQLYAS